MSMPFKQATSVQNFRTFTIVNIDHRPMSILKPNVGHTDLIIFLKTNFQYTK